MGFVNAKPVFIFISLLFSPPAFAAVDRFPSDPVTVKFFSEGPNLSLGFQSLDPTAAVGEVEYQPNVGSPAGISLSYAGLFGFSYITEINEEKVTDDKGRTSYDDYRFTFAFDSFMVNLNYLRYHGFFIENSDQIDPSLPDDEPFIRRGDIKSSNVGGSFVYVFSAERFSLPAILDQTQRQEQSGGSWMAGASHSEFEFTGDSALIPDQVQDQFGSDATIFRGRFSTLSATLGYGYTWVFRSKFYISGLVMVGTGRQLRSYRTENGHVSDDGRVEKFDARFGIGYNGDTFFLGAHSYGDATTFKTESIRIRAELLNFQIFWGFRF